MHYPDATDDVAESEEGNNQRTEVVNIVCPVNEPPSANFIYSPENPIVNQIVTFSASKSKDPDGIITNYEWDFGDGNTGEEEIVNHIYSSAKSYTVNLTVTDNDGAKDSVSETNMLNKILYHAAL